MTQGRAADERRRRWSREDGIPVPWMAWAAVAAVFVALRFAAAFTMPVFGMELDHLSGAWQAHIGVTDDRYIPTLFQALSALLLGIDDGELWPRLVAAASSATIPAALWLARRDIGGGGAALIALALVALDPVGIGLGSSANAMALDLVAAAWVYALLVRWPGNLLAAAAIGAATALCGPAPMLVVLAWAVTNSGWRDRGWLPAGAAAAAGAIAGLILASWRFGLGFDELVVPSLDLLATGSERPWSTASGGELSLLYQAPLLVGAAVAIGLRFGGIGPRISPFVLAWSAFAAGWWAFSAAQENPAPAAFLALPAAFALAPALVSASKAALRVDPVFAAVGIGLMTFFLLLAGAVVADWARLERAGDTGDQVLVALFVVAALMGVALTVYARATAALVLPALVAGLALTIPGTLRIATGSTEPLISPATAPVSEDLRDLAVARRDDTGGEIVIHPDLEEAVTWPFRDSGVLLVSSRVPDTAEVVLWPADAPVPAGFVVLPGDWALTQTIRTPTADVLDYLHWLLDRNTLAARPDRIAVYTRDQP